MVFDWIAFSGFIALAFFSDDMKKLGPLVSLMMLKVLTS